MEKGKRNREKGKTSSLIFEWSNRKPPALSEVEGNTENLKNEVKNRMVSYSRAFVFIPPDDGLCFVIGKRVRRWRLLNLKTRSGRLSLCTGLYLYTLSEQGFWSLSPLIHQKKKQQPYF